MTRISATLGYFVGSLLPRTAWLGVLSEGADLIGWLAVFIALGAAAPLSADWKGRTP